MEHYTGFDVSLELFELLGGGVFAAKSIEYDPNLIFSRIVLPRRPPNVSDDWLEYFGAIVRCQSNQWHVLRSLLSSLRPGQGPPSAGCRASPEGYAQRREK